MGMFRFNTISKTSMIFSIDHQKTRSMIKFSPSQEYVHVILFHNVVLSASTVDYYKVDKEDIVMADTQETAPPTLPPTAQTLPSQPLDVVFIERRGKVEINTLLSPLINTFRK